MRLKKGIIYVSAVISLALSACIEIERFDAPNSYQKTKKGAMIGELIGAMGGLMTGKNGNDKRNRPVIGNQLDKQEADLRRDIGNENVFVQNTGDRLVVTLPQDILFAIDSTSLRSDLMADLGALSGNLQSYRDTTVQVIGHTDNTGAASHNQAFSVNRANSISNVLLNNGVAPSRIVAMGRGEDQPVASNLTVQGRNQNRRVEIVIFPNAVSG